MSSNLLPPHPNRGPAQHPEGERSVIGAVLLDPDSIDEVPGLKAEDFFIEKHRLIFAGLLEMRDAGTPISLITVRDHLKPHEEAIGGVVYISQLQDGVPTSAHIKAYAKMVTDAACKRRVQWAGTEMVKMATDEDLKADDLVEQTEVLVDQATRLDERGKGMATAKTVINKAFKRIEDAIASPDGITGVTTGMKDIDWMTAGLQDGDFILIGGRPSMGKTALALNWMIAAARTGVKCACFSLEMSEAQIGERLLGAESCVNIQTAKRNKSGDADWARMASAGTRLAGYDYYVDDTSSTTISEIRAKCRKLKNLGWVMIDYLQLVKPMGGDGRNNQVSEISRGCKMLAGELKCPVVVLSQLNRELEKRSNKRPIMSDLRDSGSLEQDADVIVFVYREEHYQTDPEPKIVGIAEVNIAKQRNGPTGVAKLAFKKEFTLFRDLAYND